eukprot:COSAG05_NODE_3596_length_1969_cov_12.494652_1_plen_147_part_00
MHLVIEDTIAVCEGGFKAACVPTEFYFVVFLHFHSRGRTRIGSWGRQAFGYVDGKAVTRCVESQVERGHIPASYVRPGSLAASAPATERHTARRRMAQTKRAHHVGWGVLGPQQKVFPAGLNEGGESGGGAGEGSVPIRRRETRWF